MAKSRAQQAAIAISMKKAGKKPKRMLKGGKSKTLNKVSKQLAKASKLHAAQSKKIGKLARTMQKGGEYTVQSGDYMSTIAKKYNMSTSELMALNPQVNERGDIRPGQKIITKAPSDSSGRSLFSAGPQLLAVAADTAYDKVKDVAKTVDQYSPASFLLKQAIPTNVRTFVKDIVGIDRDETLDQRDLSPQEKAALKRAVERAEKEYKAGRRKNRVIQYADYATHLNEDGTVRKGYKDQYSDIGGGSSLLMAKNMLPFSGKRADYSMKTTLGQASYDIDEDGNITIKDTYDFNNPGDEPVQRAATDIYGQLRNLGTMYGADSTKKGRDILINLRDGGYPKSSNKEFMRRMGYYQAGGLGATPMYGSNTIPGTPETAAITYQEADQAKLKALEEQLKEAQESTKFQEEAEAEIQKQAATISGIEQGVSQGTKALDKLGAFDKLKEQGAQRLAQQATKDLIGQAGLRLGAESAGQLGKTIAPKLFEKATLSAIPSSSSLPASLANFSTPALTTTPMSSLSLSTPGASKLAQIGSSGAGASKGLIGGVGTGGVGAIASLAGEGLKMASDDQDMTTMNVGETIGSGLSGIGTGIGTAMTTAALLGSSLGPVGTAAGVVGGALYGLGKGLVQRGKARKEQEKAERKKEQQLQKIGAERRREALKSKEYSGFDFGANLQRGGFSGKLDTIQDGLTLAGLAGPIGPVADIANTVISAGRGLYSGVTGDTEAAKRHAMNTGVNLVSAIPVIGDTLSAPRAVKAGANLAQKAIVKGKKVKAGANVLQAANIVNPTGTFKPSVDMNQTFASETTGVRPPIIPEMMNLPKFPQQPPIPKIGPSMRKDGGVKLPGGVAKPIPGSDAIEFKGRSHAQGGIMVDPMTEVEGNETMDQVTMKKGGKRDYFFSQHLKMGGKSFAQRHKDILKNGGRQKDIDALAKLQEKKAGRNPNAVKLGAGGYYQGGGTFKRNPNDFGQTYDDGTPVYNEQGLVQPPASLVQDFQNRMFPPVVGDFDPITEMPSATTTSGGSSTKSEEKEKERETFEFTPMPTRPVDLSKITFNPVQPFQGFPTNTNFLTQDSDGDGIPDYVDFTDNSSDPTIPLRPLADDRTTDVEETTNVDESQVSEEDKKIIDKANSGDDLTDFEEKALKRLRRDVPGLAIGAGLAQLIAPAYSFFKKDRVAEQMGAPGRIKAPTLDRVSFNTERAANAADNRAISRFIETSGVGPAGIIAKMSAYRRKQEGDLKIAAQESRVNTEIANREAQMQQQANIQNVQNRMRTDEINTRLREAQLAANQDRKTAAIDAFTERTAGLAGDLLSYKATERLARATGDMGNFERDRLRNFLRNRINPRTGKAYTNADIAKIFNKQFGEAQVTKEKKEDE